MLCIHQECDWIFDAAHLEIYTFMTQFHHTADYVTLKMDERDVKIQFHLHTIQL